MSALVAAAVIVFVTVSQSQGQGSMNVSVNTYAFNVPANLPSQDPYSAQNLENILQGMQTGNWPMGSSLTPAYAMPITSGSISVAQTIYTPLTYSWNGASNPTGAFAAEHGQLLMFGGKITDPKAFTLNQVVWWLTFPNSTNTGTISGGYSQIGIGINWGPDGIPGTADDITYTSGNENTPVNEVLILYTGWGMKPPSYGDQGPDGAKSYFDALYEGNSYFVGGGFALGDKSDFLTIQVQPAPEPSSIMLGLCGGLLILFWRKRHL